MTIQYMMDKIQWQPNAIMIQWSSPEANRLDGVLSADDLLGAVREIADTNLFYLVAITGLDHGAEQNTMEVLYHFCEDAIIVTLRVILDRSQPQLESICPIIPYASPFERETAEMFGITFLNTPDDSRLFLADDWEDGVYPLRKDAFLGGVKDGKSG